MKAWLPSSQGHLCAWLRKLSHKKCGALDVAELCSDVVLAGMAWNPRDGGAGVKELGHWGHRLQGAVVLVLERDSYQRAGRIPLLSVWFPIFLASILLL